MMSGGPIATTSKKLAHVGLSAFHNEYMALKHAASTVMWIRQLLAEIGCDHMVKAPTVIYGDNTAANTLTAKDFITTGNQHIYLPYHYIKELVNDKQVQVKYMPTKMNLADIYTKSVSPQVIESLLSYAVGTDPSWQYKLGAPTAPQYKARYANAMRDWVNTWLMSTNRISAYEMMHADVCFI